MAVRRKSQSFSGGTSSYRGVTHHPTGQPQPLPSAREGCRNIVAGLLCCWHLKAFVWKLEGPAGLQAAEQSDPCPGGACSACFKFVEVVDSQSLW